MHGLVSMPPLNMQKQKNPAAIRTHATLKFALTELFSRWFTNGTRAKFAKATENAPMLVIVPTASAPMGSSNMGTILWREAPAYHHEMLDNDDKGEMSVPGSVATVLIVNKRATPGRRNMEANDI